MSGQELYDLMKNIPGGVISIAVTIVIIALGYIFVKYNVKVLETLGKLTQKLNDKIAGSVGTYMKVRNRRFKRSAQLNSGSMTHRIYNYFDSILVNTGLHRSGVTVTGLMTFIFVISGICTFLSIFVLGFNLIIVVAFAVFFLLFTIAFKYVSLTRVEKNEEVIMDAIDLLVSDVKSGIFNSIIKYKDSFHESVRPFFIECIDNVQNKGYTFEAAMEILVDQLGYSFADFASKAIYYEANRQEGTEEIFGAIIELNRQRRILRRENAEAFNSIKISLVVSFLAIGTFAVITIFSEPAMRDILINSDFGKFMLIGDVALIALVFSKLTAIRAKMI